MTDTPVSEMSFEEAMKELEQVVSKLERGDVVFFDSTSPHCGPGVTQAEIKTRRTVMYLNFAGRRALATQGAPCYAFPPQSASGSAEELPPEAGAGS